MIDNSKGACQPHPDDEALQRRFWEIFPTDAVDAYQGRPIHGEIRARYPRQQPRRHRGTPNGLAHPDDRGYQDAVIRNLEVICQALKDFGIADLNEIVPEMPCRQISGMIKLKRVKALDNYQLECVFQNDEVVIYDMRYVLEQDTPMLDPLKTESFFREVFLESGAPVWKNGYDLCPDAIWKRTHPG